MKWLPVPSVPRWWTSLPPPTRRCFATMVSRSVPSVRHARSVVAGSLLHAPRSPRPPFEVRPCGTAFSICERSRASESGSWVAARSVCTATMPQPMSTPTAAGMIAPSVGTTLPTVAPMPKWTSGIAAT